MNLNHFLIIIISIFVALAVQSGLTGQETPKNKKEQVSYWSKMKQSYTALRREYQAMKRVQQNQKQIAHNYWNWILVDHADNWMNIKKLQKKDVAKAAQKYSISRQIARKLKASIKSYISRKAKKVYARIKARLKAVVKKSPPKLAPAKKGAKKYQLPGVKSKRPPLSVRRPKKRTLKPKPLPKQKSRPKS